MTPIHSPRPGRPGPRSLLLIEHGQTELDRQRRVHGSLDPPLDRQGRRQAARLGMALAGLRHPPTRLYTSDRRRALETARLAGAITGIPVSATSALRPLDIGVFSGGRESAVARHVRPYLAHPERRIPAGDRVADWRARHVEFVRDLARRAGTGERPALVTHSNVIASLGGAKHPRNGEIFRVRLKGPNHALDV